MGNPRLLPVLLLLASASVSLAAKERGGHSHDHHGHSHDHGHGHSHGGHAHDRGDHDAHNHNEGCSSSSGEAALCSASVATHDVSAHSEAAEIHADGSMLLTSSAGAGTVPVSTHDDHKAPPAAATAASEPASPGHSHGHSHGGHSHGAHRVLSDSEKHPVTAILLTTLSGMAATVGGAIVVIGGAPSPALLGHLLSFAAGIMLYISYADLLPHAMMELGDGDELAAFWQANVWMFVGMALFAVVVMFVPEMHLGDGAAAAATDGGGGGHGHSHGKAPAHTDGTPPPVAAAAAAALVSQSRLLATGVVAAIGISLHNLPEGLIVYNQTIGGICTGDGGGGEGAGGLLGALSLPTNWRSCMSRGLAVTLAIALHNIPEGMAVASPLYASTGGRWQAMKWCILSSLCEPLAAIVFGYAFSAHLTPFIMALLNATVAGIMICLCLIELIPAACEHVSPRAAAVSNIAGQVVMFLSLYAMRSAGVH